MAATNSPSKSYSFFKLNGKADKDSTPIFWQTGKVNGKWEKIASFDTISGLLYKALIKEYTFEGVVKKSFHIELQDGDEILAIDLSHCQCTYSILNSLTNVTPGKEIKIKVYKKTNKENGKIFPGAFITDFKGDMIKWGIDVKSVPKSTPIMSGDKPFIKDGKPQYDDTPVKFFWEKHFLDHIAITSKTDPHSDIPSAPAPEMPPIEPVDDLPF